MLNLEPPVGSLDEASWEFLRFRTRRGEAGLPSFVFFPDGWVQGGEVELGWRHLQRWIKMDETGRLTFRFEESNLPENERK